MKRLLLVLFVILLCNACQDSSIFLQIEDLQSETSLTRSIQGSSEYYYWSHGVKYPLIKDDSRSYIVMKTSTLESVRSTLPDVILGAKALNNYSAAGVNPSKTTRRHADLVSFTIDNTSLVKLRYEDIVYEAPYYMTTDGSEIGITNIVAVKLKDSKYLSELSEIARDCNLDMLGENVHDPEILILSCTKESKGNALEIANLIYESGICKYASPEYILDIRLDYMPNDPHYSDQWNLRNVSNIGFDINYTDEVWNYISPNIQDIIVAVVDSGIYSNHDDLPLYNLSYDAHTGTYQSRVYGDHGTAVAGIIGAVSNNNVGIAGVAPGVKIMSVSWCDRDNADRLGLEGPTTDFALANGIRFAANNGAKIINNSWSIISGDVVDNIDDAIRYAYDRGCTVVFASGNQGGAITPTTSIYPASKIVVGAMDLYGQRASFSNYGTSLDLVAPGVNIWTTNWAGGYDNTYSGTSFAAPHVSAIAALMLAANPSL